MAEVFTEVGVISLRSIRTVRSGTRILIEVLVGRDRPVKWMISNFKLSRVSEASNTGC